MSIVSYTGSRKRAYEGNNYPLAKFSPSLRQIGIIQPSPMITKRRGYIPTYTNDYGRRNYYRKYSGPSNYVSTTNPRPERKYVDVGFLNNSIPGIGAITLLNGIGQGTAATERIGTLVNVRDTYATITVQPGATPIPIACRLMVIWDKQSNGALPAVADVLAGNNFWSPNNLTNRDRFVTLINKTYAVSPEGPQILTDKIYAKINMQSSYTGVGEFISNVKTGSLLLLLISSDPDVAEQPVFNAIFRTKFVDP